MEFLGITFKQKEFTFSIEHLHILSFEIFSFIKLFALLNFKIFIGIIILEKNLNFLKKMEIMNTLKLFINLSEKYILSFYIYFFILKHFNLIYI